MNDQGKIRFAVAGYGHIGRRHAEEISLHPHAILSAIADISDTARQAAADKYGIAVYEGLEQLLNSSPDVDILNICTPNGWHVPMADQALACGKHVLLEKPMGLHKKDCDQLIQNAESLGKEVFCVLQNRYSPPSRLLKQMMDDKRLGVIFWVEVNCYWNRDERYYTPGSWRGTMDLDGGPLYTQFSHFVDLLYWLFGPLKHISSRMYNFNHHQLKPIEDTGSFNFDIENGGAGLFSWSTAVWGANMESSISIIGSKGSIKVGGQYMDKLLHFHVKDMQYPALQESNAPNNYGSYQGSAANHAYVIENVVCALQGKPYEMAGAREAAASVGIIEQVYSQRT